MCLQASDFSKIILHFELHPFAFDFCIADTEKEKEAFELKRAVGVMTALKDFEEKCASLQFTTPHYHFFRAFSPALTLFQIQLKFF